MNTTLLIMAAGIGSRFGGGIKQLEPVGLSGEIIMDYSIHDAIAAGFNKIVFVIRKDGRYSGYQFHCVLLKGFLYIILREQLLVIWSVGCFGIILDVTCL